MASNIATRDELIAQGERRPLPASQATSIEQSRAVAEVQAAFTVAAMRPRDPVRALASVLESCRMKSVADSAFFKFPRGGKSVTGESIHLATEMARCWGNISYAVSELERNDARGVSEMLAVATDLETNTSSRTSFIVPHRRDKEGNSPPSPLTSMRDIYENNANMGARRLRECIFRVLPTWLVDQARDACYATLAGDENEAPLAVRIQSMVEAFEKRGISRERIEAKVGVLTSLTDIDLAGLKVSLKSIHRGEISADEEFPKVGHVETAKDIKALGNGAKAEPTPAADLDDDLGAGASDPRRTAADRILTNIGKLTTLKGYTDLMALTANDVAALPDEMAAEVRDAFAAAGARLNAEAN